MAGSGRGIPTTRVSPPGQLVDKHDLAPFARRNNQSFKFVKRRHPVADFPNAFQPPLDKGLPERLKFLFVRTIINSDMFKYELPPQ